MKFVVVKIVDCNGKTGHTSGAWCKIGQQYGSSKTINEAHTMLDDYANQLPKCDCEFEVRQEQ